MHLVAHRDDVIAGDETATTIGAADGKESQRTDTSLPMSNRGSDFQDSVTPGKRFRRSDNGNLADHLDSDLFRRCCDLTPDARALQEPAIVPTAQEDGNAISVRAAVERDAGRKRNSTAKQWRRSCRSANAFSESARGIEIHPAILYHSPLSPMRILILTPRLPWPPIDGGRIAMSRLAEGLAKVGAEVEMLSLNPRKHRGDPSASPLPLHAIDLDSSRSSAPALGAIFGGLPFMAGRFQSARFRDALRETLLRFDPDVVQIESPFLLPYAETVRSACGARVALRSLNVEFRIWEGLARNERNPIRRFAARRIAASVRKLELGFLNVPDAIIPISPSDAAEFRALGCTRPIHVAPCGVSLPNLAPESHEQGRVGFIGSLDFRPNQQAVTWIIDELWPRVISRNPAARLSIAGSGAPDWLRQRAESRSIDIRGAVDDAQEFMRTMSVIIAPLFAGGGMRIKTLEAMAVAKPVVATTLGAGGIEVEHGRDILLADDADAFAGFVALLLRDPATASRIGNAGRATVAARYDNETIARALLQFYESLR
jgi:glycosyltransferase involved in cell wall biosynthesis